MILLQILRNAEGSSSAIEETVRKLERSAKRGELSDVHAHDRFLALFVDPDPALASIRLQSTDRGEELLGKLLLERARQVYVSASSPWQDDDVELVHDLRVAARRLREALSIARPLVRRRDRKRADERLSKLARVLGERRMIDVFLRDVRAHVEGGGMPHVPELLELLEARRLETNHDLARRFTPTKLVSHGLAVVALALKPRHGSIALSDLAGAVLLARADRTASLVASVDDPRAMSRHHQLRIALKHLRYALEILSEAYAEEIDVDRTISPLRALQDALGDLNDANELLAFAVRSEPKLAASKGPSMRLSHGLRHLRQIADLRFQAARRLVTANARDLLAATREAAARITL